MDNMLWLVLDTIRETCDRRESCKDCPCAGSYTDADYGVRYYCALYEVPGKWQTDIIRDNLEKRAESEVIHREREQAYMRGYEDASEKYRTHMTENRRC